MSERSGVSASVALAVLALMVSLPFLTPGGLPPLPDFYRESLALGLGLVAVALLALNRGAIEFPLISVWSAALGLFLLLQPSWASVPYRESARIAGLYLFWAAGIMWAGSCLRKDDIERASKVLAVAIALAALVSAGVGWIQFLGTTDWFGLPPLVINGRTYGLLSQPNLHANYLVAGAASIAYLWSTRSLSGPTALSCGALLSGAIAFSGSRAAFLELGALIFVLLWLGRRNEDMRAAKRFGLGLAACLALALLIGWMTAYVPSSAASARASGNVLAEGVRLSIYEAAFRTWVAAPFSGVGMGGFAWAHYTTPTPWIGAVPMLPEYNAHNVILQFLAETGIFGTGMLVSAIVLWYFASGRAPVEAWRSWAIGIVSVEIVHSLVEYPLWYANFLGLAALFMGSTDPRMYRMRSSLLGRSLILGGVAIGCLSLGSAVHDHRVLAGLDQQQEDQSAEQRQGAIEALRRSLLAPYVDRRLASSLRLDSDNLGDKIAFNGRVMRFLPIASVVHKQILLLAIARRDAEAVELLSHLARLQPDSLLALYDSLRRVPYATLPINSPTRLEIGRLAAGVRGA